ncbi:unnamed protein product [Bursaphelenchus okinawaensis]|uniref:Tripeptidyl-peptidase 2 n=1 Tax=Bursaphelenchus okinawaensis TaxID=465554 RepID=A0A811JQA5_9BILA|nr:unnamed protein product [Bursaphelenchus okinawaensis]CAG9077522.1 unnamed protein product [Bursaphelenchus okinawaensis]
MVEDQFPSHQLIPKDIVKQPEFLAKHPEFDGRGTVIAILDMGVDLAAPGLQTTSTGLPKIIDAVNFTGAGDVITTEIRKPNENGEIIGLTGRKLKVLSTWKNPSNEYRLGLKRLFELYPQELQCRIKESRRDRNVTQEHAPLISDNLKKLNDHIISVGQTSKNLTDKWKRKDLEFQLEYPRSFVNKMDSGPVLDCIVWHDGDKWVACLDNTFNGNLSECTVMTDFKTSRQWGYITPEDSLTYCLAIRNNGNLLEITTPSGSHGTHCAHIAAAYYPDQPECSGLAPGAQIVSIVIGDHRNKGRSLGQSVSRAINYCAEIGVDLVNFSYGSAHSKVYPTGTLLSYLNKLVNDYGIPFFASAGNEGPALSSVTDPAAQTSAIFSVGAVLPEEAAEVLYGTMEKRQTHMLHFSSRGPTSDGGLGLNFSAPGAAYAGMPSYSLNAAELKNGTSMAAPNAAGCAACLLTAAKAHNIKMSPLKLKLALENSAKIPENSEKLTKLDYGHGILDLEAAYDVLQKLHLPAELSAFTITVGHVSMGGSDQEKRGIYIRDPYQLKNNFDYKVWVEPYFKNSQVENTTKINFQRHVRLESTVPYLKHAKNILLTNNCSCFQVRVDPKNLEAGKVHYSEILAYEVDPKTKLTSTAGPIFRVPVTVIKPIELDEGSNLMKTNMNLTAGQPERLFIKCPPHSTEVNVKVRSTDPFSTTKVYLNFAQKVAAQDDYTLYTLEPKAELKVTKWAGPRGSLEFCAVLDWSNFDTEATIDVEFEFLGYYGNLGDMYTASAVGELSLYNDICPLTFSPTVSYNWVKRHELPKNFEIEPLDERVYFMDNVKMYGLYLTYKVTVDACATHRFALPGVADHYYGNEIECLSLQLFDHQRFIQPTSGKEYQNLDKGDYRLVVQMRHKDTTFLEKFTAVALEIKSKIKPVNLSLYSSYSDAQRRRNSSPTVSIRPGQSKKLWYNGMITESLPNWVKAGDCLVGNMSLRPQDLGQTVYMHISSFPKANMNKTGRIVELKGKKEEEKTAEDKFKEAMRDFQITQMKETKDEKIATSLYQQLIKQYPENVKVLSARLSLLYNEKTRNVKEIYEMSQKIIEFVGVDVVLQHSGNRNQKDIDMIDNKNSINEKRQQLEEAYRILADTLLDDYLAKNVDNIPSAFKNQFKLTFDNGYLEKTEQLEGSWLGWTRKHLSQGCLKETVAEVKEETEIKEEKEEGKEEKEVDSDAQSENEAEADKEGNSSGEEESADEGIEMRPLKPSTSSISSQEDLLSESRITTKDSGVELCELSQGSSTVSLAIVEPSKNQVIAEKGDINHVVVGDLVDEKSSNSELKVTLELIGQVMTEFGRISHMTTNEVRILKVKQFLCHGLKGLALKKLIKVTNQKEAVGVWKVMFELADQLGWTLISERYRDFYLSRYCIPNRAF